MREMKRAYNEKRIRTSCSLSMCKSPDVSMVGGALRINAGNGRIFDCAISIGHISLQIGGKVEASVIAKGGLLGPDDKAIWIQLSMAKRDDFWLEINVSEPTLRHMQLRNQNDVA